MLANLLQINIWEVIQTAYFDENSSVLPHFIPAQESAGNLSLSIHFT